MKQKAINEFRSFQRRYNYGKPVAPSALRKLLRKRVLSKWTRADIFRLLGDIYADKEKESAAVKSYRMANRLAPNEIYKARIALTKRDAGSKAAAELLWHIKWKKLGKNDQWFYWTVSIDVALTDYDSTRLLWIFSNIPASLKKDPIIKQDLSFARSVIRLLKQFKRIGPKTGKRDRKTKQI